MSVPHSLEAPAVAQHHDEHRWPVRLGLAGMAVGAVMAFNALQNLVHHLTWSELEIVLGAVLLVGSWRLYWRDHRAIRACKAWAWTTLAYVVVTAAWIMTWLSRYLGTVSGVPADTRGAAFLGFVVTMLVLAAFPLLLIYWLGRDDVRREYESW